MHQGAVLTNFQDAQLTMQEKVQPRMEKRRCFHGLVNYQALVQTDVAAQT
jgi:hypothetical protein